MFLKHNRIPAVVRKPIPALGGEPRHGADADPVAFDGGTGLSSLGPEELGVDAGARRVHHLDKPRRALGAGFVRAGVLGPRGLVP